MAQLRRNLVWGALAAGLLAPVLSAPGALADDEVTYVVASDKITTADVEYFDVDGTQEEAGVKLPWRTTTTVADLHSLHNGARIHAHWEQPQSGSTVTVRVLFQGKQLCQFVQDGGNASCVGVLN